MLGYFTYDVFIVLYCVAGFFLLAGPMLNVNINAASEALIHSPHLSPHSASGVASPMPSHPPPPPPPVYLPASAASLIALAKTATQSSSEVYCGFRCSQPRE